MDPRKLRYGKTALKKAYAQLIKLKAGRADALESQAAKLSGMVAQGWISEIDVYKTFRQASIHNGLADIDRPQAIDRCIREGLEKGKNRPLPLIEFDSWDGSNIPNTPAPNRRSKADRLVGAVRTAVWKEANRDWYNDYQRGYMRRWRAKRVKLAEQ